MHGTVIPSRSRPRTRPLATALAVAAAALAGCGLERSTGPRPVEPPATRAAAIVYAPLPEAVSSFGAVGHDGWVYLYGGHLTTTHTYSSQGVSGRFHRMNLARREGWEALPEGPRLQGMNLAAHAGKIYRIGGMQPRNQQGEKTANFSVADCARFNPSSRSWEPMPPLPEPRSSHDIAVIGDRLYVVGGWNLRGSDSELWYEAGLWIDLAAAAPQWKPFKQPFARRALIVAAYRGKLYAMGGINDDGDIVREVDIYDPATDAWSKGPKLPEGGANGFGPAACTMGDDLLVSLADGGVYRLDGLAGRWEKIGSATPRIVHRIVPHGSRVLVLGGATLKGVNLSEVEVVEVPAKANTPSGR